ncbi:resolvase [Sinorhizobium meliloti]|uniref:Resolvase n=1 Tax=Rhizobium meliloti TaxID=382 RepID=A0A2J0YT81_RHIML|nr:resolvase [Sinorhizobium meliloti]
MISFSSISRCWSCRDFSFSLAAFWVLRTRRNSISINSCWDRPELHRLLDELDEGDVVVVWKLDRLTRSLKDMLLILEKIEAAGAGFRSLTEAIDTTTPAGRMMMQMLGSFAEFERAIVRERTMAGLRAAGERGRKGGRRPKLTSDQRSEIIGMLNEGRPAAEIARLFSIHRATVGRIGAEVKIAVR